MSSVPLSLGYMPFEVLANICGMLSANDMSSMCRLSRTFDEMMAPVLYKAVEWDGPVYPPPVMSKCANNPVLAFERRPWLRKCVRSVAVFSRTKWRGERPSGSLVENICTELELLPSLSRLYWGKRNNLDLLVHPYNFGPVIKTVAKIPTIREIQLPCISIYSIPTGFLDPLNREFTAISVVLDAAAAPVEQWIEQNRASLYELNITVFNAQLKFTKSFRNVRRFSLERIINMPDSIATIKEMWYLQELTMGFHPDKVLPWEPATIEPAILDNLQSFKINVLNKKFDSRRYPERLALTTFHCYRLLARHATDLQALHICAHSPRLHPEIEGDDLMKEIVESHKTTIRSLRLDEMTITEETLLRLSTECIHLRELGLGVGVTPERLGLDAFTTVGTVSPSLEHLALTFSDRVYPPDEFEVQHFLRQGMPRLQKLDIYASKAFWGVKGRPHYVRWECQWKYDEDLGVPRRHVMMMARADHLWRDGS